MGEEEKRQSHPERIGTYKERIGTYNRPHLRSQGLPMETGRSNGSLGPFSVFLSDTNPDNVSKSSKIDIFSEGIFLR